MVIINVGYRRYDTLLVTSAKICALLLPCLYYSDVREKTMGSMSNDLLE